MEPSPPHLDRGLRIQVTVDLCLGPPAFMLFAVISFARSLMCALGCSQKRLNLIDLHSE